jgi:hypothetical protein
MIGHMPPAEPGIRTTPLLVGGTLLVVFVAWVVIHRMADLDAQMARRGTVPPSERGTGLASVVLPTPKPVEAVAPAPPAPPAETPIEPAAAAEPLATATVATPEPAPQAPPSPAPAPVAPAVPSPVATAAPFASAAPVATAAPPAAVSPASQDVATPPVAKTEASTSTPVPKPTAAPAPAAAPAPSGPWWPAPRPTFLNLLHAGYLGEYSAVVLLFDGEFKSTDGIAQVITVTRPDGSKVQEAWRIGPNGRTLILPVLPGTYRVDIAPNLADTKGQILGMPLGGAVVVR